MPEMSDNSFPSSAFYRLAGRPGDQGLALGRLVAPLLLPGPRREYLDAVARHTGVAQGVSRAQAETWLAGLPSAVQEEIDGMARGAAAAGGIPGSALRELDVAEWLYADIAGGGGAACSAITLETDRRAWVARNCDWLPAQLLRGHAVTLHDHRGDSGRIPILAMGIAGDIDVDTGVNAAGLWLHVHTMHATDAPTPGRARLSWLFWAREALETCETIDEVDALLARVQRDRGMILVVVEGATQRRAVFECARTTHERHDSGPGFQCATNHPAGKHPSDPARLARSRPNGTIGRRASLEALAASTHVWSPPHDLFEILAHPRVEMREPAPLRTIYAAVCCPSTREAWFCTGRAPAASAGVWARIRWPGG